MPPPRLLSSHEVSLKPDSTRLTRRGPRACGAALALALALAMVQDAGAAPRALGDTTTVESWRLGNGLRVVTRDIPGAPGVAVTLALGAGSELDPKGREGQMQLLAYAEFLSTAGPIPERKIEEMQSIRPLGWNVEAGRRYTRITEVARTSQLAGVLHEMALRLKGVTVTAASLAAATGAAKDLLARNFRDRIPLALYYQVREIATPTGYEGAMRYAAGAGLAGLRPGEIQQRLRELYVPANAVLSLAGDLTASGIDLHRLLAAEFETLPPGRAVSMPAPAPLAPAIHVVMRDDLGDEVLGAVGVFAPALDDTSHPSFYMHTLLLGAAVSVRWGRTSLEPSRFQYSLFDDPAMARFYPNVTASDVDSARIREEYRESLIAFSHDRIGQDEFKQLHDGVRWMFGGEMTPELRARAAKEPGVSLALSTSAATRELWGGETFWSEYLRHFDAVDHPSFLRWIDKFSDPGRQAQLLLEPKP